MARRFLGWLTWWLVLLSLWIVVDDSIKTDELLAGAGAAALAGLVAEIAGTQAAIRIHLRLPWLVPAVRLPAEVLGDTWTVLAALWWRLTRGQEPRSGFVEMPVRFGSDTSEGRARRALLVGGRSVAPNTLVLGIDRERGVMVAHQLMKKDRDRSR